MPKGCMQGTRWSPRLLLAVRLKSATELATYRQSLFNHPHVSFSTSTPPSKRFRSKAERASRPKFRLLTESELRVKSHNLYDPQRQQYNGAVNHTSSYDPFNTGSREIPPNPKHHPTASFSSTDTGALEEEMLWHATHNPANSQLPNILELLICERLSLPEAAHYEAALRWQSSPTHGSADQVRQLLDEMKTRGIELNAIICTGILRTMVAHPDIEIIQEVIETCERLWITLDRDILQLITVAYLRAGMVEMAMEYLENMEARDYTPDVKLWGPETTMGGQPVDVWVYVMFMRHFVQTGDGEALLRMCYRLSDDSSIGIPFARREMDVPFAFWGWLLETVVEHHIGGKEIIHWIWGIWVHRGLVVPDKELRGKIIQRLMKTGFDGMVVKVLALEYFCMDEAEMRRMVKDVVDIGAMQGKSIDSIGQGWSNLELLKEYLKPEWKEERDQAEKQWSMFYGKPRDGKLGKSARIDPWAYLTRGNDQGKSWARVERGSRAIAERKGLAEQVRRFHKQEKLRYEFLDGLPPKMVRDIEALEMILLPNDVRMMYKFQGPGRNFIERMDLCRTAMSKYITPTVFNQARRERKRFKVLAAQRSLRFP